MTKERSLPRWFPRDATKGWVHAEYSLLPGSTDSRFRRERNGAKGRTQEIERLIARSLRAAVDLEALGQVAINVDCDVLNADGQNPMRVDHRRRHRPSACCAPPHRLERLPSPDLRPSDDDRHNGWTAPSLSDVERANHEMAVMPNELAAISVGLLESNVWLDLDYHLDSRADVDMNVIKTSDDRYVEVQATGEEATTTVKSSRPSWPWPTVDLRPSGTPRSPLTRQNERHLFGYATLTRVEWDEPDLNQRPRHLPVPRSPTKLLSLSVLATSTFPSRLPMWTPTVAEPDNGFKTHTPMVLHEP